MSLSPIAENDYTRAARWRVSCRIARGVLLVCCLSTSAKSAPGASERTAHELYDALKAQRVDPAAVYRIEPENRISVRRGDATLAFDEGILAFFSALDGQITGAVFSGRGHVLAAPRDPVEKQQMARFLNATVLDEDFTSGYLRFTDGTAGELIAQLNNANLAAGNDPAFAARWESLVAEFNAGQTLRVLESLLTQNPKPYFYAGIEGAATGAMDLYYDRQLEESFLLGQPRRAAENQNGYYYDVWVSYALPGDVAAPPGFRALTYTLDTTIAQNKALEATAIVELEAVTGGERVVPFALARTLSVDRITDEQGAPVEFFHNEGLNPQERSGRGTDVLFAVLPRATPAAQRFRLQIHYRGNVIEDAGNGVLVVQARDSWYPHIGDTAAFARYELTFHWPHKMQLVATGMKTDEHIDGEYRVGRWHTDDPIPVAGFNLGEYAFASVPAGNYTVEVYANRQLEEALRDRMQPPMALSEGQLRFDRHGAIAAEHIGETPPPSPASALKELGKEIDSSIQFYERFSGPFPFRSLCVSQIPGSFGQGWPGLLYLSTFAYLPAEAQRQAGISSSGQEHFTQLMPFHEVAHQWWGNRVGWSSYRDQWIDEAIATYLALMFSDSRKAQDHQLRVWLERFRESLLVKPENQSAAVADTGALTLGSRLDSSKAPRDYDVLIYCKGGWVIHMLRELLRQGQAQDPDARFRALLQTLATKYAYRALSTAELQKEVEAVMTPSMDLEGGHSMEWFFDEWVRGTGIPHYRVEFTAKAAEKGYLVKGTLTQSGVARSFIAPVPIYAASGANHAVYLGTVTAEGAKTAFHFTTLTLPGKLLIDPGMTLLCATD
ncbi:MAG: M1 family aminopeptidase [Candidatus Acidiferrum sp.]